PGVGLVALPDDRDSVLRELERRARTPRPPTAPLESLFAGFRGPFTAYSAATLRLAKLRDSLAAAKAELDTLPRDAPAYSQLYAVLAGSPTPSRRHRTGPSTRTPSWTARGAASWGAATAC